jgi:DNA polymerase-1
LLGVLRSCPSPAGLDLEFTYVKKRHFLDYTRITCMTLAYRDDAGVHPVFIPAFENDDLIQQLKPWLEDPAAGKVGHNLISADAHVLRNHDIVLRGIVGDTLRMSRMSYNSKDIKHGLKPCLQREFGYNTRDLKDILSRPKRGKGKVYKKTGLRMPGKTAPVQVRTLYCEGEVATFSHKTREPIEQHEYWEHYNRRPFIEYAALDAKGTLELYEVLKPRLVKLPAKCGTNLDLYTNFWQPYCELIAKTEVTGVALDTEACRAGAAQADIDIGAIDDALWLSIPRGRLSDWNWNSNDDLKELLYHDWRLPRAAIKGTMRAIKPTAPGEFSVAEASLHWLQLQVPGGEQHVVLDLIRKRKKALRLRGYLTSLPGFVHPDGRLHPMVAPSTDTGRLAASLPPLQQIPGTKGDKYGIRRAFVASPGCSLVVADYSQLEVYVLAHFLLKLFGDSSIADALATGDVYGAIAKECWPNQLAGIAADEVKFHSSPDVKACRDKAKIVVLATNYCMSAMGLSVSLLDEAGVSVGLEAANSLLGTYGNRFPGVVEFQKYMARMAATHGGVADILGFWRPLPEARSEYEGTRAAGARKAANTPIQGSAARVVAAAQLMLDQSAAFANAGARQVLQVHDEIIVECPTENALYVQGLLEHAMVHPGIDLLVPLKVEAKVAQCWADGK